MIPLLLKKDDLPNNTIIGGSVDPNLYAMSIKDREIFVIEFLLGTKLYDKILADFNAKTLEGVYETLYTEYVKPILIYSVASEFIATHNYKVTNGGVYRNSPDNAEAASKKEVDFVAREYSLKSEAYISRLKKFLCTISIPEYTQSQDNQYDIYPNREMHYTGGWLLH